MIEGLGKRPTAYDVEVPRKMSVEEFRFLAKHQSLRLLGFNNCPISDDHVAELAPLKRLERLFLDGTRITDASLKVLAKLPKLADLTLCDTAVTGKGLAAFAGHRGLKCLWLDGAAVTDKTIDAVCNIPRLGILRIPRTKITFDGLMKLARHPTLKVNGVKQFTAAQMAEFAAEQRRLARGGKEISLAQEEIDAAKAVLKSFFKAMHKWEAEAMRLNEGDSVDSEVDARIQRECREIFGKHCSKKPRKSEKPELISLQSPSEYASTKFTEVEPLSKTKILYYKTNTRGNQSRYLVVKEDGRWVVDSVQSMGDGRWERDYF